MRNIRRCRGRMCAGPIFGKFIQLESITVVIILSVRAGVALNNASSSVI
jgi:hypothetical protein